MDKQGPDLVHLRDTPVDLHNCTPVHLRPTQEGPRMLAPEVVDQVRELARQGWGTQRIARRLGIARNTVRRYLAGAVVGHQERPAARSLDDNARRQAVALFDSLAEGNAVVIQRELEQRGTLVGLRTLQRAVAVHRRERRALAKATVRFETAPGQQLQIDFGEKLVRIHHQYVKVYLMTAILAYSRRLYTRAFLAQRQDDWLEGIEGAFAQFGGLTQEVLCDNASPLVTSHDRASGEVVFHPGFAAFCRDRDLKPRACRPYRARTKGKIERGVGYVKHNALAGRGFDSFAALQRHLAWWIDAVADRRIHGTTRERPIDRFQRDERSALRPLPPRPLPTRTRRLRRRVSNDCFVDIDTIRYSVPFRHVHETVDVVVQAETVEILLRGVCVARHARCVEPRAWVRDPAHFDGLWRRETEAPSPAGSSVPPIVNPVARPLSVYAELVEGVQG